MHLEEGQEEEEKEVDSLLELPPHHKKFHYEKLLHRLPPLFDTLLLTYGQTPFTVVAPLHTWHRQFSLCPVQPKPAIIFAPNPLLPHPPA